MRSALVLGLYFVVLKYIDARPWQESGLSYSKKWLHECLAGIAIAFFVMSLIFLVEWLSGGLTITGFGWQRNGDIYWLLPILAFLIQMLSVGFYEEVISRGFLLRNIAEGFTFGKTTPFLGTVIAIIISSSLFGLGHAGNPNATIFAVLNIFLAGIMLAIPFVITGRLALSIGLHFAWNFFQGGFFGFSISGMVVRNSVIQIHQEGPEWWTGGAFGPEGGLIGVLGIILIMILIIIYLKVTGVPLEFATSFSNNFTENRRKLKPTDELA
ncbi:MAG: CPBP family intramembrane glutamic endopeptidase [Balneolaceae bacterium]